MIDPTKEEMVEFLKSQGCDDEFDREEAIYWFAYCYHGGQWTNLYSVLSTSGYNPGPIASEPEDPYWYHRLEQEYGR